MLMRTHVMCGTQDDNRRAFERLVRKLMRLPSRPAVVLVNMFAWQSAGGRWVGVSLGRAPGASTAGFDGMR